MSDEQVRTSEDEVEAHGFDSVEDSESRTQSRLIAMPRTSRDTRSVWTDVEDRRRGPTSNSGTA